MHVLMERLIIVFLSFNSLCTHKTLLTFALIQPLTEYISRSVQTL